MLFREPEYRRMLLLFVSKNFVKPPITVSEPSGNPLHLRSARDRRGGREN